MARRRSCTSGSRKLTDRERAIRESHEGIELVPPSVDFMNAYLAEIREGWRDYRHDLAALRDPERFRAFVDKLNSGASLFGRDSCLVRWLVHRENGLLLGRVRIKNIHEPSHSSVWSAPSAALGGNISYSVPTRHRGRGYSTLMLSMALDECFSLGRTSVTYCVDRDNIPSIRATLACGGIPSGRFDMTFDRYRIPLLSI